MSKPSVIMTEFNGCQWTTLGDYRALHDELTRLKQENEVLIGVAEFYGDERNWTSQELFAGRISLHEDTDDTDDFAEDCFCPDSAGGKRAREAIKKVKETRDGGAK